MSDWPVGTGEMAGRIRAHDWASTPLGPMAGWPQSLRTALDIVLASGHPMQLVWGRGQTILYNDAYAPMLGDRHPAALGIPFKAAWADIWDDVEPLVRRVFAGDTMTFENLPLVMTRHGYPEDTWWNFSYSPVRDESGAVAGLLNVTLDTTARVRADRAEAASRESEERLSVALEAGRMGTYRLDLRTGEQEWSDGQYDILGLTRGVDTPSRELFLSLVHPEDLHRVEFSAEDIRSPDTYLDGEFRILRRDGQTRWITAHALALFDENGHPAELIGVNQDVTDQRRLAAAMHSSEERLREFSETSSDILWIRRAEDLQWEYLSPAFHKVYGISRQDAMRGDNLRSWADLVLPEDREAALAAIERVRKGERMTFEYRIRRPEDGQVRWLRDTDFPMRDEAGAVVRVAGIGHDLTELKQAEEHQRLLLAELQHRVRNTLAVIRSIVKRTAATSQGKDEFFTHLDGRIAAFARVQAAVTRDPTKGVDLTLLVAEELRVVGAQEGRGLSIKGPAIELLPKAAETLGLAIHELATNAVKYGALSVEPGRIDIGWKLLAEDGRRLLRFSWREHGLKNLPRKPRRAGFGTEILERRLVYETDGKTTLDFEPGGLSVEIVLPLDQLTGAAKPTPTA